MCGRYTLRTPLEEFSKTFGVTSETPDLREFAPRYNVAPGTEVAAVVRDGEDRKLETLRWGLVPSWADDPAIGNRMINARSETAPEKPSFRSAFKRRRCLIPADGFYEWRRDGDEKQPYYITMESGEPFAFAGLWESWGEGEVLSCAILTTEANALMGEIHHRMPVILPPEDYSLWLDPDAEREDLTAMLVPYPDRDLEAYPVSRFVNRPANDDPRCIQPAA